MLTDLTDVCCLSLLLYLMMPAELPKSACSRSLGKQYAPFEWFCCQTQHTCVLNKPIFTSWHHAAPYCTSHYLICTAQHAYISSSAAQHSTAQHSTAQHSTAQHGTARHGTAQHSTDSHLHRPPSPVALINQLLILRCKLLLLLESPQCDQP